MGLPHPSDVVRVRLRATLGAAGGGQEEAQFGFWLHRVHRSGNPTDWASDVVQIAEGVRDRWVEHIAFTTAWNATVVMDTVRADHVSATDGKVLDQGVATFTGDNVWQGSGAGSLPWECGLAVSLFNYERGIFAANKGRKRGRMYLPPFSVAVMGESTGELSPGPMGYLTDQFGAFFNDVQGMEVGDSTPPNDADFCDLVIVSVGTPLKTLPPTIYPVNHVYMDSKVDSQRRRQRQQVPRQTTVTDINRA